MDPPDQVGLREGEQVVVAAQLVREILEALAAILGFRQLLALDHRTHRAIEDEDAFGEQRFDPGGMRWDVHDRDSRKQKTRSACARNGLRSSSL